MFHKKFVELLLNLLALLLFLVVLITSHNDVLKIIVCFNAIALKDSTWSNSA